MAEGNSQKRIPLETLEEMFDNISRNTNWDMRKPMLWGYFFTNKEPEALAKTKDILIRKGYEFVEIRRSEKEQEDDPDKWWLHVQKREIHTPKSLDQRNDELTELAKQSGIDDYDGMDCGPVV